MKAEINSAICTGCRACAAFCPEVFEMDGNNVAKVLIDPIYPALIETVIQTRSCCPVYAISLSDY